jgi:hypothetical protein
MDGRRLRGWMISAKGLAADLNALAPKGPRAFVTLRGRYLRDISAAAHIDSRTQAPRSADVLARGY